ncbi:MAG: tetratricopeptide repeat protein [Anaerolineales bacterium]
MRRQIMPKAAPVPIEALKKAAEEQPNEAGPQIRLGWALYGAGRLQEALQVMEAASRRHPRDLEVAYGLGLTLKRSGDSEAARKQFQLVSEMVDTVIDRTRAAILRRIAHGHLNMLERGRWDLEKEIWGKA